MRFFTARLLKCREISIARIYANGYTSGAPAPAPTPTPAKKSNEDLATEVVRGLWEMAKNARVVSRWPATITMPFNRSLMIA